MSAPKICHAPSPAVSTEAHRETGLGPRRPVGLFGLRSPGRADWRSRKGAQDAPRASSPARHPAAVCALLYAHTTLSGRCRH